MIQKMQKRANRITFRNHWYVQVFDQTINEHIYKVYSYGNWYELY